MREIKAIIQPFMLGKVCDALSQIDGLPGITVSHVMGWGKARAVGATETSMESGKTFAKKTKLEIVVPEALASTVVKTIAESAHTGNVGDGKIFVYLVSDLVKIRTGESGELAI
jgi:nitrogen regulatory protein P-II 1